MYKLVSAIGHGSVAYFIIVHVHVKLICLPDVNVQWILLKEEIKWKMLDYSGTWAKSLGGKGSVQLQNCGSSKLLTR